MATSYLVLAFPRHDTAAVTVDTIKVIDAWSSTGNIAGARRTLIENIQAGYYEAYVGWDVRVIVSDRRNDYYVAPAR